MFKGIKWKLAATYIFLVILSVTILALFMTHVLRENYINNLRSEMEKNLYLVAVIIEGENYKEMQEHILEIGRNIDSRITVIDRFGKVLMDSHENPEAMENHINRPEFIDAFTEGRGTSVRYSTTVQMEMMYIAKPITLPGNQGGAIRIAVSLAKINADIRRLQRVLGLTLILSIIIAASIAIKLSHHITRPVEELTKVAKLIAKGNFNHKSLNTRSDEIGELTEAINQMALELDERLTQIKNGKERLETVLSHIGSGVIFVDFDGIIQLINKEAIKILTIKGDVKGKPLLGVIQNYELTQWLEEAKKETIYKRGEININYPLRKIVELTITSIPGIQRGLVILIYDITEIRELEKMRADFVANVSHEFKTPLTSIKGFAENLGEGGIDQATRKEFSEIIKRESERLEHIVNDLLTLSRVESKELPYKVELVNISSVLKDTYRRYVENAVSKGMNLDLKVQEQLNIIGDMEKLEIAFSNIVDNSIKYSNKGSITIEGYTEDNGVTVKISDQGIGIPSSDIGRIFERFYRVDKDRSRVTGGTGLGLSIVKHIIRHHGGTISVNSRVNEGTSITIFLPFKSPL
jgi:two-component system phosphate regulon sensor histidine kinase PhoR